MKVEGKCAVIIGGAQGIGRGFVEILLQHGAKVCVGDVLVEKGQQTAQELASKYVTDDVFFIKCDVTSPSNVEAFFREAAERLGGPIEIFSSAAGIIDEGNWRASIDVNLTGSVSCTHEALKYMGRNNGGHGGVVVLVSSIMGIMPTAPTPVYSATKSGLVAFTRAWACSHGHHGVRFNTVCPAFTDTAILGHLTAPGRVLYPDLVKQRMQAHPHVMKPSDVAKTFLQCVQDDVMNGEAMKVSLKDGAVVTEPAVFLPF